MESTSIEVSDNLILHIDPEDDEIGLEQVYAFKTTHSCEVVIKPSEIRHLIAALTEAAVLLANEVQKRN